MVSPWQIAYISVKATVRPLMLFEILSSIGVK